MKRLANYLDEHGFIGHFDDNGVLEFGDGSQRIFMQELFKFFLNSCPVMLLHRVIEFRETVNSYFNQLLLSNGEPSRHWNRKMWYGQDKIMSRDNLWPYVCCLQAGGMRKEALDLFLKLAKRGFFLWNTKHIGGELKKFQVPDWAGIGMIMTLVKTILFGNGALNVLSSIFSLWFMYIFFGHKFFPNHIYNMPYLVSFCLPFFLDDLLFALQMLFRIVRGYFDRDDCGDDLNTTCRLVSGTIVQLPVLSFIMGQIYLHFMPVAFPHKDYRVIYSDIGLVSRFQHYFAKDKNPPLDKIAEEVILKLRSGR